MIFDGIHDLLWSKIGLPWSWNPRSLNMHVCLVMGDVEGGYLRGYFTSKEDVDVLLDWATSRIAASVGLVVVSPLSKR